jgi:hypothetical protein
LTGILKGSSVKSDNQRHHGLSAPSLAFACPAAIRQSTSPAPELWFSGPKFCSAQGGPRLLL